MINPAIQVSIGSIPLFEKHGFPPEAQARCISPLY
jgi:hypothetical protein